MSDSLDLKSIIDSSVAALKPKFTDMPIERLEAFIRAQPDLGDDAEIIDMRGGDEKTGASSGIVIFTLRSNGEDAEYVLRYAPMNNPHRIFAEYNIAGQYRLQKKLHGAGLPVPNSHWVDETGTILGLPGYVMDIENGEVAHGSAYTGGLIAEATPERRQELFDEVLRIQGQIHATQWQALGLEQDVCTADGRTPIERYINWFWKTAEWTQPAQMDRLKKVRDWLVANQPGYGPDDHCLVHGDPGLGNYMFADDKIVAILDWELAGILQPAYDLAIHCSMADYFRAAATPEVAAIIPTEREWIASYERVNATRVRDFDYFRKLATLPSLVVSLSMNRSMPGEMGVKHLEMMEATWASVESK